MNVPSGYSALDLVGFTDKGDYLPSATYVKNDLVHYNDKIWKCLIDDTTGIVPTTGLNWDIWIDQSNSLDGLADVEITNATDGQELSYDATTQKWKNTSKIQSLTNEVKDMNEDTAGLLDNLKVNGAVNMLPNTATTQTINGITFTVNEDGTVTANGTATAEARLNLGSFNVKANTVYTLSDGIDTLEYDIVTASLYVTSSPSQGTSWYWRTDHDTTHDARTRKANVDAVSTAHIIISSGVTVSNLTFKPMFTLASYKGDYVPYAKSNKELTEDVADIQDTLTNQLGLFQLIPIGGIKNETKTFTFTTTSRFILIGSNVSTADGSLFLFGGIGISNSVVEEVKKGSGLTWTVNNLVLTLTSSLTSTTNLFMLLLSGSAPTIS